MHSIILRLKRSWCPAVHISADNYRFISSMHLPEDWAQLPMWWDKKRLCTQKSIPLAVFTGVNGLWTKWNKQYAHNSLCLPFLKNGITWFMVKMTVNLAHLEFSLFLFFFFNMLLLFPVGWHLSISGWWSLLSCNAMYCTNIVIQMGPINLWGTAD